MTHSRGVTPHSAAADFSASKIVSFNYHLYYNRFFKKFNPFLFFPQFFTLTAQVLSFDLFQFLLMESGFLHYPQATSDLHFLHMLSIIMGMFEAAKESRSPRSN